MKMGKEFVTVTVLAVSLLFLVGCGKDDKHPTTTTNQGTTDTTTADTGTGSGTTNHTPVITSLTANPATVVISGATSLSCNATDADNDTLSYSWSASSGTIAGSGATVSWTAPATVGTATITCKASDGTVEAGAQASVAVEEWILPTQLVSSVGGSTVYRVGGSTVYIDFIINENGRLLAAIEDGAVYNGRLYLVWGKSNSSGTTYDHAYLSIFDSNTVNAIELSRTEIVNPEGGRTCCAVMALDNDGIYLAGDIGGSRTFLTAYDFSATVLWAVHLPQYLDDTDIRGILVQDGFIYMAGDIYGQVPGFTNAGIGDNSGRCDVLIGKYTTSGNLVWFSQWGTIGMDNGRNIKIMPDGLYVSARAGFTDSFIPVSAPTYQGELTLKYDFNGNLLSVIQ